MRHVCAPTHLVWRTALLRTRDGRIDARYQPDMAYMLRRWFRPSTLLTRSPTSRSLIRSAGCTSGEGGRASVGGQKKMLFKHPVHFWERFLHSLLRTFIIVYLCVSLRVFLYHRTCIIFDLHLYRAFHMFLSDQHVWIC